jgi:predicted small lipoprotein YifL
MKRLTTLFIPLGAFALLLLFSGCGQSGPLYVPGNPSTMAVPPSAPAAAEEEKEEDSDPPDSD